MKELIIEINGIKYKVKYSFRALLLFEELTDRKIDTIKDTVTDTLLIFYCILKSNNRDIFNFTFDEFVDLIDEFPETVVTFTDFMQESATEQTKGSNTTPKKKKR